MSKTTIKKAENGATTVFQTSIGGSCLSIYRLTRKTMQMLNKKTENGTPALFHTAQNNYPRKCFLLLEKEANVNKKGSMVQHYYSRQHRMVTYVLLLESNANVNQTKKNTAIRLFQAAKNEYFRVRSVLLDVNVNSEKGNDASSLLKAAQYGHAVICTVLLEEKKHKYHEKNGKYYYYY